MPQTTAQSNAAGPTVQLAKFVAALKYRDLPPQAVELAKVCILDALGAAYLGATLPWGRIVIKYAEQSGGKPESVVIGGRTRSDAGNAALANGTMAHAFETDDVLICALHHPGVVVVPAALAIAEKEGASGKAFIEAVVAGYEVMNRVGKAIGTESHVMRGFFPTSTNGTFGAAAAAGRLLRLTAGQHVDALGIAGSQSGGLFEGIKEGVMTKRFGAGKAAQNGVMAAELAKLGFTGSRTVLEGSWGYLKAFSDKAFPRELTANLGKRFNIMETTFKPYPCCKALHSAIDATLYLKREHGIDAADVAGIVVGGYEKLVRMHDIYAPATAMAAQFSIPYVVAVSLVKGAPDVASFDDRRIRDKKVLALARKVKLARDAEVARHFPAHEPSKVTIRLKNGKRYSKAVICSKGTPENPMSRQELEAKFMSYASLIIPRRQAQKVVDMIWSLEAVGNVRKLAALLSRRG